MERIVKAGCCCEYGRAHGIYTRYNRYKTKGQTMEVMNESIGDGPLQRTHSLAMSGHSRVWVRFVWTAFTWV